jgi:hypothetical protein
MNYHIVVHEGKKSSTAATHSRPTTAETPSSSGQRARSSRSTLGYAPTCRCRCDGFLPAVQRCLHAHAGAVSLRCGARLFGAALSDVHAVIIGVFWRDMTDMIAKICTATSTASASTCSPSAVDRACISCQLLNVATSFRINASFKSRLRFTP